MRRVWLACACLLLGLCAAGTAVADCFSASVRPGTDYSSLARADLDAAISRLEGDVAPTHRPALTGDALTAALIELADAYYWGDRTREADATATRALTTLSASTSRILADRVRLVHASMLDVVGQTRRALAEYEAAAREVPESAPYYHCLLIDRGYLRYRNGLFGSALTDLVAAYERARDDGRRAERMEIASLLSMVYLSLEFFDEAIALANEGIDYHRSAGESNLLADALFRRGDALNASGQYEKAIADLTEAAALWQRTGNDFGLISANATLCEARRHIGQFAAALSACRDAAERARGYHDPEVVKMVELTRGELDLARGRPGAALGRLEVFARATSVELPRGLWMRYHLAKQQALATIGDHRSAYEAARAYLALARAAASEVNSQRVAALRVRFETQRKERELKLARQEQAVLAARADSDRLLRNFSLAITVLVIAGGFLVGVGTRRRRVAESAQRAAEQRLDALSRLTGGIAHDFNNLMTVVQQAAGLLVRHPSVRHDDDALALVAETREAANAGGAITRQLLAFARQQQLKPESVALDEYFARTRAILERAAGERVQLRFDLPEPGTTVRIDRGQLTAALLNLVVNARDAMPAEGTVTVRATGEQARGLVRIEVTDSGLGMPPEVAERAVEPFFSTKGPGVGSGLGLSMVDGFVRQSGGRLELASSPGRGTTVTIWLPEDRAA